ncbi:hypothetical protein [Streptomyces sp. NPDC003393]
MTSRRPVPRLGRHGRGNRSADVLRPERLPRRRAGEGEPRLLGAPERAGRAVAYLPG